MATRLLTTAVKGAAATGVNKSIVLLLEMDFAAGLLHVCNLNYTFAYNGYDWRGVGALGAVEQVNETDTLESAMMRYTLSNVAGDNYFDALNQTYKNRPCSFWLAFLDTNGQVIPDPVMLHYGLMDQMVVQDGGESIAVTLTVRSRLSDWSKPRIRRFTDEDQQGEYPNDRGCQYVVDGASKEIVWVGPMTRLQDWESRLVEEFNDAIGRTFAFGRHDCATFTARCVQSVTGIDFFEVYEPYATALGSARAVKKAGGLEAIANKALGEPLPTPLMAQRGDVVLVLNEGSLAFAVVMGAYAFAPGKNGLVAVPMDQWQKSMEGQLRWLN